MHRLHFIRLIQQGPSKQTEAIAYARQNLTQYVGRHGKEVQALMGTLLYLPHGIQSSPYSHLLDPTLWLDIHDVFTREACTLFGLSLDSPLSVWYVNRLSLVTLRNPESKETINLYRCLL